MSAQEITLIIFGLIGGLAVFLYGIYLASEGLQKVGGSRLKAILGFLTKNRLKGLMIGALATIATQSSSATTVILVSFANAGLIELQQTIGIILGADIGTTFTVQLIAFKISEYASLMIALGLLINLLSKEKKIKYIGQILLGFGFVFLGMGIMSNACHPLKSYEPFTNRLLDFAESPLLTLLLATVFTAIIQSSAATLGLTLVFAIEGLLTLKGAIPIILGANIGTCATALLASIGTSREGKQVAVIHLLFKIGGVALFLPFLAPFAKLVTHTSSSLTRQIANAHTAFNLVNTLIFLPFTVYLGVLVKKIIPKKKKKEIPSAVKYLDEQILNIPSLALNSVSKEVLRMANLIYKMLEHFPEVLFKENEKAFAELRKQENLVDTLNRGITYYLRKISQKRLSEEESHKEITFLYIINDLENMGDIIDKNLIPLAEKKIEKDLAFSIEGELELTKFHKKVLHTLEIVINGFKKNDLVSAKKIIESKAEIGNLEKELHKRHIARLHRDLPESLQTNTIHLDVINNLKRINSHAINIAYTLLGRI